MQIQISSIENGFLIGYPRQIDPKMAKQMSPEDIQRFMSQPECHYCEDYEGVCSFIKRFFFNSSVNN